MLIKNILPILILSLVGCSYDNQPPAPATDSSVDAFAASLIKNYAENDIVIDLGTYFENDHVQLYVDEGLVFDKNVTTDPSTGFADGITFQSSKPNIRVKMIINGEIWESNLDLTRGHFFHIRSGGVKTEIKQSTYPFYYD